MLPLAMDLQADSSIIQVPQSWEIRKKFIDYLPRKDQISLTATCKFLFNQRYQYINSQTWWRIPQPAEPIAYFVQKNGTLESWQPPIKSLSLSLPKIDIPLLTLAIQERETFFQSLEALHFSEPIGEEELTLIMTKCKS